MWVTSILVCGSTGSLGVTHFQQCYSLLYMDAEFTIHYFDGYIYIVFLIHPFDFCYDQCSRMTNSLILTDFSAMLDSILAGKETIFHLNVNSSLFFSVHVFRVRVRLGLVTDLYHMVIVRLLTNHFSVFTWHDYDYDYDYMYWKNSKF